MKLGLPHNSVHSTSQIGAEFKATESKEKIHEPTSGGWCCCLSFVSLGVGLGSIALAVIVSPFFAILVALGVVTFICICCGIYQVDPNSARILMLYGEYIGSVKKNGLFWTNPFYSKIPISQQL